ncbi:hypothetical protein GCM10010452_35190 [Crossiella cryophila]
MGGFAVAPRETKVSIDFGGGSKFTVDVAQLDNLIAGLKAVRTKIEEINTLAMETNVMANPPSEEDFSRGAVRQIIERTIQEKDGTHTLANRAYGEAVDTLVQKLTAARDQYAGTEGANQTNFKPKG